VGSSISGLRRRDFLTSEGLRSRFAETRLPQNPLDVALPPGSRGWPAKLQKRLTDDLRLASVLIPIMQRADQLTLLLTQRAADLRHHPGQISFPGGRMEEGDEDLRVTALRETSEEVGIAPEQVSVIGYLDAMPTTTGYAVTPVIGLIEESVELVIDPVEVEYAFEVPLEFILDERSVQYGEREVEGCMVPMVEFHFEERRIWGVTAHMLQVFRKYVLKQ
jgi:8-oxo-dGTP pyrophosphatase MutT (NUDIX family)